MVDLNECLDSLRRLIAEGDINGIGAAERAVNDYVAATAPQDRRDALLRVQQAVKAHKEETSGVNLSLADTVNDYIEKLMMGFD
jgi:hypothetical protein